MPSNEYYYYRRTRRFFRIALSQDSLADYYKTNFHLLYKEKWSLTELDEMLPYERDIYIALLEQAREEEARDNGR